MNESSIQAVRARAKALYTSANADERSVLDLLLAAADDEESDAAGADVEGYVMRARRDIGSTMLRRVGADDSPGAFELQDLMSQYNQAE